MECTDRTFKNTSQRDTDKDVAKKEHIKRNRCQMLISKKPNYDWIYIDV